MKTFEVSQLQQVRDNFIASLQYKTLESKIDLSYIKNQISTTPHVATGEKFQALVIGGTYYKSAMYEKQQKTICMHESCEGTQPIYKDKKTVFSFIARLLNPSVQKVAINFAFALEPITRDGRLDGRLLQGSKEHTFHDLVGKLVGQELEEYVKFEHGRDIQVSIANDTICLLLSGRSYANASLGLAAGIVGTGLNFAYFETPEVAINLEAANFSAFPHTDELAKVDAGSANPGAALFEKAIAGAYLDKIYNEHIKSVTGNFPPVYDTQQLDNLARSFDGSMASQIAREVLTNSAMLAAAAMAAIATYLNRDMVFVMEGSVFWKGWQYQDNIGKYAQILAPDHSITCIRISESSIMGVAKLIA